jgi:hypothetical protein
MTQPSIFGVVWTGGEADHLVAELLWSAVPAGDLAIVFRAQVMERIPRGLLRPLAGVSSLLVSDLGRVVAGGRAAVAFAAAKSAEGGLVELGMSPRDARTYRLYLERGGIAIGVRADRELQRMIATNVLRTSGADAIVMAGASSPRLAPPEEALAAPPRG